MVQSQEASSILARITKESASVSASTKVFGVKSRRPPKSARVQKIELAARPQTAEDDSAVFDGTWEPVDLCVKSILEASGNGRFEPALHAVERLCRNAKNLKYVNEKLMTDITSFATNSCKRLEQIIKAGELVSFIEYYQRVVLRLSSVFSVFEQVFLSRGAVERILQEELKKLIGANQSAVAAICEAVVEELTRQRNTYIKENNYISSGSSELSQISHFSQLFDLLEPLKRRAITATASFYSSLTVDAPEFLMGVKAILEKEQIIISCFPQRFARPVMTQAVRSVCIERLKDDMSSFLPSLVAPSSHLTFHLLCGLIARADDSDAETRFSDAWISKIEGEVKESLQQSNAAAVINELLKIHQTLILCKRFLGDDRRKALFRAFKRAVNEECSKVAFLMARMCHSDILGSPGDFVLRIDDILLLFRELNAMDEFIENHRQFLAIRLLSCAKMVPQIETTFLDRIGGICGRDEVRRCEKMIADVNASAQLMAEFDLKGEIAFRSVLMSFDSWPTYPDVSLRCPPQIMEARSRFATFYKGKQPSRKLQWKPIMDQCTFRLNGALCTGSALYYLFIDSLLKGEEFDESRLGSATVQHIIRVLKKSGILRTVDGKLTVPDKIVKNRICFAVPDGISPKQNDEKCMEEVAWARGMKLEALIVLTTKKMKLATESELYDEARNTVTLMNFCVARRDFDSALQSCIVKQYVVRTDDGKIMFSGS
jgi:hypothetical protein